MLPHDNYIMHFNKNHDPRNGRFTKGSGGSISSKSSKKSNSNSSKAEEYIKKHPDQAKYITIGDDGRMQFDVMRWQIDEDLKQASGRLIRKKTKNQNVENKTSNKPDKSMDILEMSDDELKKRINRLRMEDEYKRLKKSDLNKKGSNYLRNLPSRTFDKIFFTLLGAVVGATGKKISEKLTDML